MNTPSNKNRIILFGATWDLAKRKLIPALFSLDQKNILGDTEILAIGRKPMSDTEFQEYLKKETIIREPSSEKLEEFLSRIEYLEFPFSDPEWYEPLKKRLEKDKERVNSFYLSTPPELFQTIVAGLTRIGFDKAPSRVAFEKPFGFDLESAKALNSFVQKAFSEDRIYRIDHYVGKETIQNILAFRFANALFEPIWDNKHIDNIQITATETLGVENRGGYYDHSGALRDMVQNHLFQVLSLIAMEPPHSLESHALRDEKVKVIRALHLGEDLASRVVFGQYEGYTKENWVSPDSRTETFAAMKLEARNWRFEGIPIYLRTGKALAEKTTKIVVEFKKMAPILYNEKDNLDHNRIVFEVSPTEWIHLGFNIKEYGDAKATRPAWSKFVQTTEWPEAYERILSDLLAADHTLFTRWDMIEESWKLVDGLIRCKENCPILHKYTPGSQGPDAANALLEADGRKWF